MVFRTWNVISSGHTVDWGNTTACRWVWEGRWLLLLPVRGVASPESRQCWSSNATLPECLGYIGKPRLAWLNFQALTQGSKRNPKAQRIARTAPKIFWTIRGHYALKQGFSGKSHQKVPPRVRQNLCHTSSLGYLFCPWRKQEAHRGWLVSLMISMHHMMYWRWLAENDVPTCWLSAWVTVRSLIVTYR